MGRGSLKKDFTLVAVMSFERRMYLRLATPCLLVVLATILFAWVTSTLSTIPAVLGASAMWPDLPFYVCFTGALVFAVMSGIQFLRLWQREQGKAEVCLVCSCLLGAERRGRFGPYRKCLGCERNYSLARR
jgi:hypothetical protein